MDADRWLARAEAAEEKVRALEAELNEIYGRDAAVLHLLHTPAVNWSSIQQVQSILQDRGHKVSNTSSQELSGIDDPLVPVLLAYRDAAVRARTYGREWLSKHRHPITGRIHASYLQCGSEAGRMSCQRPNMQNLPRTSDYRSFIRPEEGAALVKADYSQIELRVAAALAQDKVMLTEFNAGRDLHVYTASRLLGVPVEQVTKAQRQVAKAVNFGLLFGMGAQKLQAYAAQNYQVQLTSAEAKSHRSRWLATYRGIERWHRRTGAQLERRKQIDTRTMIGRRRLGMPFYSAVLNTPVQGTAADGFKLALARLYANRHEAPKARVVAVVHDEILVECPTTVADETAAWLVRHMEAAMTEVVGGAVPIVAETTIGRDWAGTPLEDAYEKPAA